MILACVVTLAAASTIGLAILSTDTAARASLFGDPIDDPKPNTRLFGDPIKDPKPNTRLFGDPINDPKPN